MGRDSNHTRFPPMIWLLAISKNALKLEYLFYYYRTKNEHVPLFFVDDGLSLPMSRRIQTCSPGFSQFYIDSDRAKTGKHQGNICTQIRNLPEGKSRPLAYVWR